MRCCLFLFLLFQFAALRAQDHGFPFGKTTYRELDMKTCDFDTSAYAVVLNEFGEASMDNSNNNNLLFEYHVKIKILKQRGTELANIEIPLRKGEGRAELIREIDASSFNYENGTMKEMKLEARGIYKETVSKFWDVTKFAIPNVRAGSVIEYRYILESPFRYNFRTWEFQSDIPKMYSEYWATIPANYKYNISLRGYQKLDKNESEVIRECFTPGGGNRADCSRLKWGMKNVPAFVEEDYMTAKSNFLSAIYFELSELEFFDGRKDKITKEWKDAETELRRDEKFGLQIKRGKDIMEDHVDVLTLGENDPLTKAKKIYAFIQGWYRWDDVYGIFSEFGIKKAFDRKTGNIGDINLSLVAALRYAGLEASPMILSTRTNGLPTELYPVISDFNYVIAHLNVGGKVYLLDATDDFLSFGMIPERCLNGKGRVLPEGESYWHELKPSEREKQISMLTLKFDPTGTLVGTIQTSFMGYKAMAERKAFFSEGGPEAYIKKMEERWKKIDVTNFEIKNADDLDKPFVVKLEVSIDALDDLGQGNFLFNPFVIERWTQNPFKSTERLYPVDFGAPIEEVVILTLEYPAGYELAEVPSKVGLALPNQGGRYLFECNNVANKLSMNSSLLIGKTVFTSEEYHFLKELFNHVIAVQQADLVFKRNR